MSSYQLPEDQDYIEVQPPYGSEREWDDADQQQTTRHSSTSGQSKLSSSSSSSRSGKTRSKRKGSKTTTTTTVNQSGSDTEKESSEMSSSRISKHSSSSHVSRRDKPVSAASKKKTDDWTEVTEPDERRRIQNRIAQRKFREKAREQKDRAQRDAQNQQYAGSAYHIPDPEDFTLDDGGDLSGLPWGGLNMRHVVARGHASASTGHHTHSHHSGHTSSSVMYTPGPAPVDQALYQMNPYGYAAHPMDASSATSSDVYGYDSPYSGYYDYDPSAAADGTHSM